MNREEAIAYMRQVLASRQRPARAEPAAPLTAAEERQRERIITSRGAAPLYPTLRPPAREDGGDRD